ncbi:MAG: hypothetical protein HZB31_08110 [Nitrospirae bacterium]|nr:hypothetical protein [Nitrospirota bacterium]
MRIRETAAKPKGALVLSSKTDTSAPGAAALRNADSVQPNRKNSLTNAKPLSVRIKDFLFAPPEEGKLSNLTALVLLSILIGGIVLVYGYIIWLLSASPGTFRTMLKFLLFVGLPILLLSLFETGRKILKGLFIVLQVLLCVLDMVSSISGGRSRGFSGGSGEFGGGGASGKW